MSGAYVLAGVFTGAMIARISATETAWCLLIFPAAALFAAAWHLERKR